MTSRRKQTNIPTILYVDYSPELDSDRRRLDGLRRYAVSRKWRVETLEHRDCSPSSLREALSRLHPATTASVCFAPQGCSRFFRRGDAGRRIADG